MPDSEMLKERRSQLSPAKQMLLKKRMQGQTADRPLESPIMPRSQDSQVPLSYTQQRLWFLDQLQSNSTYNIPLAVKIHGTLQADVLEQCLNAVIQRHEVLRTTFHTQNGLPFQIIVPYLRLALIVKDLAHLSDQEQEKTVQHIASQEARALFDLSQGPLMRATLLCLSTTEYVLLLTQHHIISDRWSLGVWLQEIAVFYKDFSAGKQPSLPPLPFQYADYALWQREWLSGQRHDEQLKYWLERLKDAPTALDLPGDHPRPAVPTFQGTRQSICLPQDLTAALRSRSQQEGVTLFMILLAAWNILLFRYSGSKDILVGAPVANRARSELESLIGFFVNTLVLRTDLEDNPTVRQLLQQIRKTALEAFAHQDLPFEQLVEDLHLERDMSRTVLIQTALAWQNTPLPPLHFSGITLEPLEVDTGTAKFDLLLSLEETEQEIRGTLEYNTDLFEDSTISRMIGHYQRLLEGIVAYPEQHIAQLPMLTEQEHTQLVAWNETGTEYAHDTCIHRLFEEQVQRSPEAIAILFQGNQWTYQELNNYANQLAHRLKDLDIGPGKLVAVYMERSMEMLPALLGILKAGGAYVPLEATTPTARLHWILNSLSITCIITQNGLLSQLASIDPLPELKHVLCLDNAENSQPQHDENLAEQSYQIYPSAELKRMPQANLPIQGRPEDLAYIIFTSGSTGTPKGVMVTHSPVINLIEWVNRTFNVGPTDRVLFITSLCFDLSVYDIFGILAAGGSIHIASSQDLQEPTRLLHILSTQSITFWDSAPAALVQLTPFLTSRIAEQEQDSALLRLVFLSGDWIPINLPDQLKAAFPAVEVISLGGATEATIWSNYYPIQEVNPRWPSIPYGRPIQNASYYILDDTFSLCPIGIPGHLYIGGECLSLGYANEPELTDKKFLPSPFNTQPGARIYKTGDLARWRPDGNMEFLGRDDSQVKIRGFRIELGEIESVLRQHPGVDHAIVQAFGAIKQDRRLVAYIVPRRNQMLEVAALRVYLQKYLPDYMQPAAFLFLDTLPVTSNGKLDRKKLPVPDFSQSQLATSFVAPRDTVELQLALLWEEVLKVSPISITANFFELGGHSLLAVQLMAQIEQRFGQQYPLALLFQEATIERFANVLRQHKTEVSDSSVVGLQTAGSNNPLFFVHAGGGSVFCYIPLARYMGQAQPFYALQTPGLNDDKELHTDMQELASYYIQEIRSIQPEGPYNLGGWCVGGIIAYEMARQLQNAGQEVALLALLDSAPPAGGNGRDDNDVTLFAQFAWDLARLFGKNLPSSYKIALLGIIGSTLPLLGDQPVDTHLVAEFITDLLTELQGPDATTTYELLQHLTLDEQLQHLLAQVQAANIDPPETEQAYLYHLYSIYSTNIRAIHQYVPEMYAGDITLFRAQEELKNDPEDTMLSWQEMTSARVETHIVPGDHYNFLKEPHVQSLANTLKSRLESNV